MLIHFAWLLPQRVFPCGGMHCRSAFKSTHSLKFFWGESFWWNTSHNRRMFSVEPNRPLGLSSGLIGSDRTFSRLRPPQTVWQHSVALAQLLYFVSRVIHKDFEIKQLKSCNREALHKKGWSILSKQQRGHTSNTFIPYSLQPWRWCQQFLLRRQQYISLSDGVNTQEMDYCVVLITMGVWSNLLWVNYL